LPIIQAPRTGVHGGAIAIAATAAGGTRMHRGRDFAILPHRDQAMKEMFYDTSTGAICAVLLVTMILAIEAGYRIGRRRARHADAAFKEHINTVQSSLLGILALMLAFTFSISVSRFDSRNEAVVEEANALGTTWLRAGLLPDGVRAESQKALRDYTALRVRATRISGVEHDEYARMVTATEDAQLALWSLARRAAAADPNPVRTGLFVQSLNETIDNFGRLDAALSRHVPEAVLLLLYVTFLMASAIVGYAAGVGGHRASFVSYIMVALIVVLVFLILDLDRPRRGLIEVSAKPLTDLQALMDRAPAS
jgi:hypothetical protein